MTHFDIATIVHAYLEAVAFTDSDNWETPDADFSDAALAQARPTVNDFVSQAGDLIDGLNLEQVGHDIWLTQNHHSAGFWDRSLGEVGKRLTAIAHGLGYSDSYVNGQGEVDLT